MGFLSPDLFSKTYDEFDKVTSYGTIDFSGSRFGG